MLTVSDNIITPPDLCWGLFWQRWEVVVAHCCSCICRYRDMCDYGDQEMVLPYHGALLLGNIDALLLVDGDALLRVPREDT